MKKFHHKVIIDSFLKWKNNFEEDKNEESTNSVNDIVTKT